MIVLDELIRCVDQEVVRLNYCEGHIRHHRECWNVFRKYMAAKNEQYLTVPLATQFLLEKYGIELYTHEKMTSYKMLMRRAVLMLLEFQATGLMYKRMPRGAHDFPPAFESICNAHLNHLREENLSDGSIRQHRSSLERFTLYEAARGIADMNQIDITAIYDYLESLAGCSKSHANSTIWRLKAFFIYLHQNGFYCADIADSWPSVRVEKYCGLPETFTIEEETRLLAAVDRGNALGKRDYAILLIAVRYGLRVSDIRGLQFDNIDFRNDKISLTQKKTGKPLQFELFPDVGWALIDYLKNGRPSAATTSKIFVRMKAPYDGFSDNDNLSQLIYKYAHKAGIAANHPRCSMHMFRYTLASTLLSNDTPLPVVSSILGHSQLDTTKIYTKIDYSQLRACALEVPNAE